MSVSLTEVVRETLGNDGNQSSIDTPYTVKFATINIVVPSTVTAPEVGGIFVTDTLAVSVGYNKADAASNMVSPCGEWYSGVRKDDIDQVLLQQGWCATVGQICVPEGPVAVGSGGNIQFTLPLPETAWDMESLADENSFFVKNVYIDFMLMVLDAGKKKSITHMQTQTAIKHSSIGRQCAEERVSANIQDIIEIDMFLGLAGNETDFNTSLVQSLDVTRQTDNTVLQRDIGSKESNVLTMIVKGDNELFNREDAREYTLAVEDVISVHFLNLDKKAEVERMIAAGKAFTTENTLFDDSNSITSMKLLPTAALLEVCPLQARRGVYGCNTRREIRQRQLEYRTNSVVSLTG